MTRELFIQVSYLAASVLFILGLQEPDAARQARGGACSRPRSACCSPSCGTLLNHEIVGYDWIVGGLVLGTVIGYPLGMLVPMTAMPQRIAHLATCSARSPRRWSASPSTSDHGGGRRHRATMAALGFEVLLGALTVTGSFMAFGKLQELLPGRPVTYAGQNAVNIAALRVALGCSCTSIVDPAARRRRSTR